MFEVFAFAVNQIMSHVNAELTIIFNVAHNSEFVVSLKSKTLIRIVVFKKIVKWCSAQFGKPFNLDFFVGTLFLFTLDWLLKFKCP